MSTRRFSMVSPALWRSGRFLAVSSDAKALHLYFLTGPHQTSAGAYSVPDGYVCSDMQWTPERYQEARQSLLEADLIAFDKTTSEVYVCRWFKHCPPKGSKQEAGALRLIGEIESDAIRERVESDYLDAAPASAPESPSSNRLLTTSLMRGRP